MPKTKLHFTFDIEGKPRAVLGVTESSSGMLTLVPKGSQAIRDNLDSDTHSEAIEMLKFSVHLSNDWQVGNTLHTTLVVNGRPQIDGYHATRAIKTTGLFAPVFARQFSTMKDPVFDPYGSPRRRHSLGGIDELAFSLIAAVFVSKPDRAFDHLHAGATLPREVNIHQQVFRRFRLTLLWTFVAIPADPTGMTWVVRTLTPETITDPAEHVRNEETMNGWGEASCIDWFASTAQAMRASLLKRALEKYTPEVQKYFAECSTFFKVASMDTPEFRAHGQWAAQYPLSREALNSIGWAS